MMNQVFNPFKVIKQQGKLLQLALEKIAALEKEVLELKQSNVQDIASLTQHLSPDQLKRIGCDHYPELVKELAQELKKVSYLVPLAREVAKQPEVQQRAANYLAHRICTALSPDASTKVVAVRPDNTTTFMD